ncbi:MAG: hypothetical protein JRJ20_11670 [Deltaproteobacteria bacterium]|nr:hypothetical protein [Deltaproteobacteria bacterium]
MSGLELSETRTDILAVMYLKDTSDINSIFDDFLEMHRIVRLEETSLFEKLDVQALFDESAVDAIITQAIETDQKVGPLVENLGKRLEYGLNLVKDRSGIENFIITDEAVMDLEGFIDNLIKKMSRQESLPDAVDV